MVIELPGTCLPVCDGSTEPKMCIPEIQISQWASLWLIQKTDNRCPAGIFIRCSALLRPSLLFMLLTSSQQTLKSQNHKTTDPFVSLAMVTTVLRGCWRIPCLDDGWSSFWPGVFLPITSAGHSDWGLKRFTSECLFKSWLLQLPLALWSNKPKSTASDLKYSVLIGRTRRLLGFLFLLVTPLVTW